MEKFTIIISESGKYNYRKEDGSLLSEIWFKKAYCFKNGFGLIECEDGFNYIREDGTFLSKECFEVAYSFGSRFGVVVTKFGKWMKIFPDGSLEEVGKGIFVI